MSEPTVVLEGTELNFDRLVMENSRKGLVVVDFWAPWAGPSLRQGEVLKKLAAEYAGRFLLVTVNTDEQKAVASRFAVKSLPSFKLFRNGKVVEEFHGMQPEADYRAIVDRYLVPLGDKVRLAAAQAWNDGEHDKAIQVLAEGAMADPENLEVPEMLAKFLMRLSRFAEARQVLAALPAPQRDTPAIATLLAHLDFITTAAGVDDPQALRASVAEAPQDVAARFRLAAVCLVDDDFEGALLELMAILRIDPGYQGGAARRGLLAIFGTLGGDHELVRRYRGELARLIN